VANTKSAAKRARQGVKRAARNKSVKSSVRTEVRKVRDLLTKGDIAAVQTEINNAKHALDKAASAGVIHKSNASRRVGRLASAVAKALKATAPAQA
jgi:small subunit ribosomal protein S20